MKKGVSYRWRHLLNQLPFAFAIRSDRRLRTTRLKPVHFACYQEAAESSSHHLARHERSLRRQRVGKWLLQWTSAFAAAWIVLESTRALDVF